MTNNVLDKIIRKKEEKILNLKNTMAYHWTDHKKINKDFLYIEKITKKKGFDTYAEYWTKKLAKKLVKKYQNVDLIYSANTITHIKNLDQVFKSILLILSKKLRLILKIISFQLLQKLKKVVHRQG